MSRVQFNLLPDVKLQYMKTHRTRNLVVAICTVVTAAAILILLIMLVTVEGVQKKEMSDAQKDLTSANAKLNQVPNIDRIITVQNQLQALVGLHQNKHALSRIFTYLPQVTPQTVSISQLSLDTTQNSMTIAGNADTQKSVNSFIDTLKATTYKLGDQGDAQPAFPSVVESSFSINDANVSYSLSIQFDPNLFANNLTDGQGNKQVPKLNVPKLTTTRSADNSGGALFKKSNGGGQ